MSRPALRTTGYGPIGMLVVSGLSLGLATALSKIVLEQLAPADLFGVEVVVSAVPLFVLALLRGARPGRPHPALLLLGVLEPGLAYLLFDLGVARTAASHAALLVALDAPITLGLAVVFLRERIDLPVLASLALGVGGSVLVTGGGAAGGQSVAGDLLVVGATVSAAAYTIVARRVAPDRDVVVLTAVQMIGALLVAVPVFATTAGLGGSRLADADGAHLGLAVAVGLLGGVLPFLLFNAAISAVSASRASLVLALVPVVGAAASVLLLHESLTAAAVAGGALALAGSLLAARREEGEPDRAPTDAEPGAAAEHVGAAS